VVDARVVLVVDLVRSCEVEQEHDREDMMPRMLCDGGIDLIISTICYIQCAQMIGRLLFDS